MTNPTPNTAPTLPFQVGSDTDTQETREWMDALSAVIEAEGPERAHFLLEQLLEHARQKSIDIQMRRFGDDHAHGSGLSAGQTAGCGIGLVTH